MVMNMKKILVKIFTWLSESVACEQAMYEALYEDRIAPLVDKVLNRDSRIAKLEGELNILKAEMDSKKATAEVPAKPKRKYNKRKKADDKA